MDSGKTNKKDIFSFVRVSSMPQKISEISIYEGTLHSFATQPYLPVSYNEDKLIGLDFNPQWLFFYWDFAPQTYEIIKKHRYVVLRVYDVTYIEFNGTNAHRTFEMKIDERMRKYYVNVPQTGADYIAEIGYEEKGQFVPVLRSNHVSTPQATHSQQTKELWMNIKKRKSE